MEKNELKYWVAWSHIESIGPQRLKILYTRFPDLATAWQANPHELKRAGLSDKDTNIIVEGRKALVPDELLEHTEKLSISVMTIKDPDYPRRLKEIHSPPAVLYYRGQLPARLDTALAVVGTRKTSAYGRKITPELVSQLANAGLVIVSGLALGIDALAHDAAVSAHGTTVAVLGCGLDLVYPISNRPLAEKIIANGGALVSEYPPGTQPLKQHFPARNRIISGLSRGVLVIEGSEDSGSLITAKCALDQNRDIMAVPGNIFHHTSAGPNNLIKMGAKAVTSAQDVLDALDIPQARASQPNTPPTPVTETEKILMQCIGDETVHIDEIIQKSKLNTSTINSALTLMEMKGLVRHLGGMYYALSR